MPSMAALDAVALAAARPAAEAPELTELGEAEVELTAGVEELVECGVEDAFVDVVVVSGLGVLVVVFFVVVVVAGFQVVVVELAFQVVVGVFVVVVVFQVEEVVAAVSPNSHSP